MTSINNIAKQIIFGLILLFLFLPLIQKQTRYFSIKPLNGAIESVPNIKISSHAWFEKEYQLQKEKYLNQEFGFRNILVRIHNQICYWIFKEAHAKWVIVGKDNYMYESGYIDAYYGRDFIGEEIIADQATKLKFLQDTLQKAGKNLVIVITPGKASFFPEYIPDEWRSEKSTTNYDAYLNNFNHLNVKHLNLSPCFDSLKTKSRHPLFPQYGVHWSIYGAALGADTIIRYIEHTRDVQLAKIIITDVETSEIPRSPDDDVYAGMNLFFKPHSYKMSYPKIHIDTTGEKERPRILVIADSYFWNIHDLGVMNTVFKDYRFCFYYQEIYSNILPQQTKAAEINMKEQVENSDVILILSRNADIHRLGWGFIDDCYKWYYPKGVKN